MVKKLSKIQFNFLPAILLFVGFTAFLGSMEKKPAEIEPKSIIKKDISKREEKVEALEKFLEGQKSPLAKNARTFVEVAEKYNLDYRLLPAIACLESSCGKRIIPGSYNPFGWGIYGKNAIYFKSYDEAIEVVGKGIKDKYVSKGLDTPEKIAPVYTPPNPVGWRNGVNFFISKIDGPVTKDQTTLFSC